MYACGFWWICVARGVDMGELLCMRDKVIKLVEGLREEEVPGERRPNGKSGAYSQNTWYTEKLLLYKIK